MKRSCSKISTLLIILIATILLLSSISSAQTAPWLFFDTGNYFYDADSKMLSFSGVSSGMTQYTDDSYGFFGDDPIVGATLSFGTLKNSSSNNLIFGPDTGGSTGPVDFSIGSFITGKVTDFVVTGSGLNWGTLYDIQRLDGGPSRYVDELLANGWGSGKIYIAFTPTVGGTETFTADSSGSVSAVVAAPEPVGAILFIMGGAILAVRRFRS